MAGEADRILAQARADLHRRMTIDLADLFVNAIADANARTAQTLQEAARVIQQGVAPESFRQVHETIGLRAQQAVLNSYAQVVTAQKHVPSYRLADGGKNQRYAGGKLREALSSAAMVSASERGLRFIDTDVLDAQARHWARLNAGALGIGGGSRRTFDIRWSNFVIAALGINMVPSAGFFVPRGYWWEGNGPVPPGPTGTSQFYPAGSGPRASAQTRLFATGEGGARKSIVFQRKRVSRGIRARNFLDAGVARIAEDLGPAYDRLYKDLYERKLVSVRPARSSYRRVTHSRYR